MIGTLGNDKYRHIERVTTYLLRTDVVYQLLSSAFVESVSLSVCLIAQRNEKKLIHSFSLANVNGSLCRRPSVSLSSVCNVRAPYSGDWNFGNVSTPFGTMAIYWHYGKILRRPSQGTPPSVELNTKFDLIWFDLTRGVAEYSDVGPIKRYISETVAR